MKAEGIFLRIVLPTQFERAAALDAARTFLAAMPDQDSLAAEPEFDMDVELLRRERDESFENDMAPLGVKHLAVLSHYPWSGTLNFLQIPDEGSSLTFSSMLGDDDFTDIWRYLRRVAEATVTALPTRCATLGGILGPANPLKVLRGVAVPRTFAPWNYVSLHGLAPELADGLRGLPDCSVHPHGDGLIIEPTEDVHEKPSARFVAALEALPLEPKATYRHMTFPR